MTPQPLDKNKLALYAFILAIITLAIVGGYNLDLGLIGLKLSRS